MTNDIPVFTAHDIPDLINTLPILFGFTPEDSIVAISTYGPRHRMGFRMRLDMPAAEQFGLVAGQIVTHLAHQGAEGAIIIAVTDRIDAAARLVPQVERRLGTIRPVISAWADGKRYWTTFEDCDPAGHPYETSGHHLAVVQAIAGGQEILPSRAALAAKLDPEPAPRRRWLNHGAETVAEQITAALNTRADLAEGEVALTDLAPALEAALARRRPTDDQALRLAEWATRVRVRDALCALITPDNARDMVGLWSHVARCAPPPTSPPSLTLAGFASWLSGDGALALIAAERALSIDPYYPMAGLLLRLLEQGVPPSSWRPDFQRDRASA
ncbi:MAG: DUF4192 domain-containing protein [Aeromicrobium sp.]